jgi:hypothetical protein
MLLTPHTSMGQYLMMYEGLVLYVKEMDEDRYQRICTVRLASCSAAVRLWLWVMLTMASTT